jgi:drug/metabolite transporter (DMT)-like permease
VSAPSNARAIAPTNSRYAYGCGLVVFAGLVLSLGVFCIRGATASDAWQYLFWRALGFTSALITIASLRDQRNPLQQVMHLECFAWVSAISLGMSQITFISAVKVTTFAETFFLCSLAPLITAMLARPMLGKRIGRLVLAA